MSGFWPWPGSGGPNAAPSGAPACSGSRCSGWHACAPSTCEGVSSTLLPYGTASWTLTLRSRKLYPARHANGSQTRNESRTNFFFQAEDGIRDHQSDRNEIVLSSIHVELGERQDLVRDKAAIVVLAEESIVELK